MSLSFANLALLIFLGIAINAYWVRRLLGLATSLKDLIYFTALQTLATIVLIHIIPVTSLAIVIISIARLTLHVWLFKARLFPEALFCAVAPSLLTYLGELVFTPLCLKLWDHYCPAISLHPLGSFTKPFIITAFIPAILLFLFFLVKPNRPKLIKKKQGTEKIWWDNFVKRYVYFLPMVLVHKVIAIMAFNQLLPKSYVFGNVFFYSGTLLLPTMCIALIQAYLGSENYQKIINYHLEKYRVQQSALQVLREERHDYLNELTLISSYVQMKKWAEAQDCIAYAAANLSDRYNYATLPHDAWLTVLDFKEKEASRRKINFEVLILADPPTDFAEQRLLPKLIINLVDNAFAAASKAPIPHVQLVWYKQPDGSRSLCVSNNGEPIPPHLARQIYQGGYSSKKNNAGNNGWGLVICQKIAQELGGQLTFESNLKGTSFILTLPKVQNIVLGA